MDLYDIAIARKLSGGGGGGGGSTEVWWTGVFNSVNPEIHEGNTTLVDTDKTNYTALFNNPTNYTIAFNGTEMIYNGYDESYGCHVWKGGTFTMNVYPADGQYPNEATAYGYNITQGLEIEVTATSN